MQAATRREHAGPYWMVVYWFFVTTFMPTAAAIGLQLSVATMVALLVLIARAVYADANALNTARADAPVAA